MQCARSAISESLAAALLASLALCGCGRVRESAFPRNCSPYEDSVRPLVESRCAECHSSARAEGGYVVGPYLSTVSRRDDGTPRVEPGNAGSLFLQAVRGELPGHAALAQDEQDFLRRWVLDCRAAPERTEFHPRGWSTPTDPTQFHGSALRQKEYRFDDCQKCHGDDLRGGTSGIDCNSCHVNGPLACNTCHGDEVSAAPPRDLSQVRLTTSLGVGAHRTHVTDGPAHQAYGCASCHQDVQHAEDEGHYRRDGVFETGPAEVVLASSAAGPASWDRETATCTNSACHAPSPTDTAATRKAPVWTRVGEGEATCGSCHGAPPSSHPREALACAQCHGAGYVDGGVERSLHANGHLDFADAGTGCNSCHAGPGSTAFFDLFGRTDAGARTVGAHDAHLRAGRLRGPMGCEECHLVPQTVSAPGHIDLPPAEVFPADGGGLAWAAGVRPTYDASNGTCTAYCHSGDTGQPDQTPNLLRTPSWTGGSSQAACGTCHGLPPLDGTIGHDPGGTVPCAVCHSGSVALDGGIVITTLPDGGLTSRHLDGRITGQ